ncbi:hypothetical protein DVJ78_04620 [Humibacter sp. BT305]|nr:hypothetical protein DVJ78_04620 [Humibacter sp. BT305]
MSDSAFAVGTAVRFHEITSPAPPLEAQNALIAGLQAEGFTIAADTFTSGIWSVRYGEIGDDSRSNWSDLALEVVPLLTLVGLRRHLARCAAPVAVTPTASGSRLLTGTVWGFHGDGGTVGLAAKRVRRAAEAAAAHLGGTLQSQLMPFDRSAPLERKPFERLTRWKQR